MVQFRATTIDGVEFDASSPKGSEKLVAVKPKEVPSFEACVHVCMHVSALVTNTVAPRQKF